jgi:hypothetical protein
MPFRLHKPKTRSLLLNALIGFIIGLGCIALIISGVDQPNPEWGRFWMLRPLMVTPLVSGIGGIALLLPDMLGLKTPLKRILALFGGLLVFIIALWMGIVLGLDGTLWN